MKHWKKNPVIYEINTRVWLTDLSRHAHFPVTLGTVNDDAWDEVAALRPDAVWLMGVWERSPEGIRISNRDERNLRDFRNALSDFSPEDNAGSPYCIRRYVPDPQFGGVEGLAVAREKLSRRGIRLILDLVPNHLAHDHPWVSEFPHFFIRGTRDDLLRDPVTFVPIDGQIFACGKDPFYPAWQDVLQVNAFHPELREAMGETLARIASMCDGVRCDMAMLVMNGIFERTWGGRAGPRPELDYWEELIPEVKRLHPGFIFIAEAYWDTEWQLQQQGFDFCYDKRLYDRLKGDNARSILQHLGAEPDYQDRLIRFIENHDEDRQARAFPGDKGIAAAVVFGTLPGAKLFHEGQPDGRRIRIPVFLRRRPDETLSHDLRVFYEKLLNVISLPAFREGRWRLCPCHGWPDNGSFENLLAWSWDDGTDRILIVINYSGKEAQGMVRPPWDDLAGGSWLMGDLLSGLTYERNGSGMRDTGLFVSLGPWQFHLFRMVPA